MTDSKKPSLLQRLFGAGDPPTEPTKKDPPQDSPKRDRLLQPAVDAVMANM